MQEPSLLDYLEEKLKFWKHTPAAPAFPSPEPAPEPEEPGKPEEKAWKKFPWSSVMAVLLAFAGQRLLEPATRSLEIALLLFAAAAGLLVRALLTREWQIAPLREPESPSEEPRPRRIPLIFLFPLMVLSFFAFSGNKFNSLNLLLWLVLIVVTFAAFWIPVRPFSFAKFFEKAGSFLRHPSIQIHISGWEILFLAVFLLAVFFHTYRLDSVPNEMISDQAEKLLDVNDVLNGQYSIFFPRNTGREALQFYITAFVARVFGTGISFLSLKLGTALLLLLSLIYVYRLGNELGNRWVGLFAMGLMGIAYWPNVITRIGLRFALYPALVAPLMFYLVRGLRTLNRNDFILAGVALGIGLHGYSPYRIVPFLVAAAVILYLLHTRDAGNRKLAVNGFLLVALLALVIFLPLGRYATENPEMFGLRAFSRLSGSERAIPGSPVAIFFSNLWNAMIMPFWSDGNVWAHSVPNRPALDVIDAGLYLLGLICLIYRYIRQHRWQDIFLFLSVIVLMLPSILSLAFPEENPALNRTAGAAVPVFIIIAIALEGFLSSLWMKTGKIAGKAVVVLVGCGIFALTAAQNFDLTFNQYAEQYAAASWNTTQIGQVVRDYVDSVGDKDTAWVVGVPYWVDTRLVGINAGFPEKDYAIWPEQFETTVAETRSKLFIVRSDDIADLELLVKLYPDGFATLHKNPYPGKDFYAFLVPAVGITDQNVAPAP